jgi:hypothetical protein
MDPDFWDVYFASRQEAEEFATLVADLGLLTEDSPFVCEGGDRFGVTVLAHRPADAQAFWQLAREGSFSPAVSAQVSAWAPAGNGWSVAV